MIQYYHLTSKFGSNERNWELEWTYRYEINNEMIHHMLEGLVEDISFCPKFHINHRISEFSQWTDMAYDTWLESLHSELYNKTHYSLLTVMGKLIKPKDTLFSQLSHLT